MAERLIQYTINYKVNQASLNDIKSSLMAIQTEANKLSIDNQLTKQLNNVSHMADNLSVILNKSWNSKLGQLNLTKFNKYVTESYGSIANVKSQLESFGPTGQNAYNTIARSILGTNVQLKQSSKLLDSMAVTMKNTIKWTISSSILNTFTGSIQKAYSYVKNLDRSLNDIRIVTGKSAENMAEFATQANKAAQTLGTRTTDYTNAALIYYQQGLSDKEVQARTETTLKAANVTQQSTAEVSEQLTAVWNGYKVNAQEAELYIDKLAAVAANTASNLEELSTGMSRVASAANLMGVDVDQLNAQLSTIISVTRQAPESIGTALRSIYARMSDINSGVDEETTLGKYTEDMSKYGINVLDAKNQLRDMGDVIEEVGIKWNYFTKTQQVGLAQAMAGTRQYNNLLALFSNWDKYTKALNISKNSMGTLQKQQDIYMESTQAHLDKLRASSEDLYDSLFNADTINDFSSIFTFLIKGLTTFVDTLGGGMESLLFFGGAITRVFNQQIAGAIERQITNFQIFKENIDAAKVKQQVINAHEMQGQSIKSNSAIDLEVNYAKELLQLRGAITAEEYKELTAIQQNIGLTEERIQQQLNGLDIIKQEDETYLQYAQRQRDEVAKRINEEQNNLNSLKLSNEELLKTIELYKEGSKNSQSLKETYQIGLNIKKQLQEYLNNETISDKERLAVETALNKLKKVSLRSAAEEVLSKEELAKLGKVITINKLDEVLTDKQREQISKNILINTKAFAPLLKLINGEYTSQEEALKLLIEFQELLNQKVAQQEYMEAAKAKALHQQAVQGIVRGVSALSMTLTSLSGIFRTLADDSLSFGQKTGRVISTLLFNLPFLISNFKSLGKLMPSLAVAFKAPGAAMEMSFIAATKSVLALQTALGPLGWVLLGISATLIAVGVSAYALAKAYNADADAAKEANQRASELKKTYDEVTSAVEAFKQTVSDYSDGIKAINELEKGTLEYKQAIIDSNAKALELLNTYKDLAKYTSRNKDGLIIISEEGLEEAIDNQIKNSAIAQNNYVRAQIDALNKQQKVDFTKLSRSKSKILNPTGVDNEGNVVWKNISQSVVETIAKYMKDNNVERVDNAFDINNMFGDLNKDTIDAIEENIDEYEKMARQLNNTREQQRILAETCAESYGKLLGVIKEEEDKNLTDNEKIASSVFITSTTAYLESKEAQDKARKDYIENVRKPKNRETASTQSPNTRAVTIYEDDVREYLKNNGYTNVDSIEISKKGWGVRPSTQWSWQDTGGNTVTMSGEEILQDMADKWQISQIEKDSKAISQLALDSINGFLKFNKENITNEKVLKDLLLSGRNGKFTLDKLSITSADAKKLLEGLTNNPDEFQNIDFNWLGEAAKDQGFADAEAYYNTFIEELQKRAEISDTAALGKDAIMAMRDGAKGVTSDFLSGKLTASNAKDNEGYTALIDQLETLTTLFTELTTDAEVFANAGLIGSEIWTQAAFNIQDALNKLTLKALYEDVNNSVDEVQKKIDRLKEVAQTDDRLALSAYLESEEFTDDLNDILEKQYAIDIEIHAQAEDFFNTFETASRNLETTAAKIGEKYIIAASDMRELNNIFPGILQNYQVLKDGTIKLNKEIAASAMQRAKDEMVASAQSATDQIQKQIFILKARRAHYENVIELSKSAAKGESGAQEALLEEIANFQKQEDENDKELADAQGQRNKEVTDNARENAEILATNWAEAYRLAAEKAIAFANTAVFAHQSAVKGELVGDFEGQDFNVTYGGREGVGYTSSILADIKNKAENGDYSKIEAAAEQAILLIDKEINDMEGMIAQIGATSGELTTKFRNIAQGKGADDKGSKDKKDKMDALIDRDEIDKYHDINIEIGKLEKALSKLSKQQKKLFGKDLINNLNQQLGIIEQQKEAYQAKLAIAQAEAADLRAILELQGVTFSDDGYISNYAAVLQEKLNYLNALIARYNAMSKDEQEKFKETIETAKKEYELFKKDLERYDKVITDTIPDIEESLQDAFDKQIELQIEAFKVEIDIKLDMSEAERQFNEFKRKVIDKIKEDDFVGLSKYKLADITSYYNTAGRGIGSIQALTDQVNATVDQIKQINNTGTSNVYGDNKAQAMEDLKQYYDELINQLENIEDLVQEIKDSYLDMIDKATEKFDEQVDKYEYINDLINHDLNVIGLVYGEKAYAQMAEYYNQIERNNNKELDFLKKRVAYAEEMMKKETDEKAKEKWIKEWQDALSKLNDKVEDSLQNIIDKYANAVKQIFDKLNKKVTGGLGLDYVSEEWNLINKNADQYLDTINSLYSIQTLENKFLESINNTDSLSAQQKLSDLMNEQLTMLREKEKITQYDVDRANKLYEIALKEIALQEAQKNKSQMRLRRDSQGNYSYQFVSDEDSIAQARQELLDAQNDLYNFDKEKYRNNLNEIYEIYQEFQDKIIQLYEDQTLSAEERQQKEALLVEQYGQLINGLVEQNETIKTNLHQSAFDSLALMYQVDVENFKNMSREEQEELMNSLIPQWESGVQQMTDKFAGEGGFIPTCQEAFEELRQTTAEYQTSLDELAAAAGVDFAYMAEGYDRNIGLAQELLIANDELINKYAEEISAIIAVIGQLDALIAQYQAAQAAAIAATQAAYAFMQAQIDVQTAANQAAQQAQQAAAAASKPSASASSNSSSSANKTSSSSASQQVHGYKIHMLTAEGDEVMHITNIANKDTAQTMMQANLERIKKVYYANGYVSTSVWGEAYDTGGYTGDWGTKNGKMAILHEKELVLNKDDTRNMLNAVSIVRDIAGVFDNIRSNIMSKVSGFMSGFMMPQSTNSADQLEQNVNINVTFPNVRDSREIEDAINNLINRASQYAYTKR